MIAPQPFSLRIFVVDGDPDGLRIAERSNWTGRVLIFPRRLFPHIKGRDEFAQTGVYLLLGPREDGEGESLYIGEGDPVLPRLESHFSKKDFWTRAVVFVANSQHLNKAHVQFLESRLVRLALDAKRVPLDNGNSPSDPTLSEADRADMTVFLGNMLGILPMFSVSAFEKAERPRYGNDPGQPIELFCRGKGVAAVGYETNQGMLVRGGSEAVSVENEVPSLGIHLIPVFRLRRDLIARGVLEPSGPVLRFTDDYVFNSPSLAAAVILGSSTNGRMAWKDAKGRTLKAIQEQGSGAA